jgi:hypothetical protein
MSKRTINDLREILFATMEDLRAGKIDVDKAKQIANLGQTIVNSAVAETKHIAREGGSGTGFIFNADEAPVKKNWAREQTKSEYEKVMDKYQ